MNNYVVTVEWEGNKVSKYRVQASSPERAAFDVAVVWHCDFAENHARKIKEVRVADFDERG